MLRGVLLAESLRVGHELRVEGLTLRRVVRKDVSDSTTPAQPNVWTFLEFAAPDDAAEVLADTLAAALLAEGGWYADFGVAEDHVVVFAGRTFRYRRHVSSCAQSGQSS